MLSNAYFPAKFRFDTAENEPAKNLQNFRKMHLILRAKGLTRGARRLALLGRVLAHGAQLGVAARGGAVARTRPDGSQSA